MANFNWTIEKLFVQDVDGQQGYVVNAYYVITGTEDTFISSTSNIARFSTSSTSPFIPFADLKESDVIGWVQQILGVDGINSLYASLQGQIDSQKNPPVVPILAPLPWHKSH
jgi:hypothetical protein